MDYILLDFLTEQNTPTIHCYCFSNAENPKKDAIERVEKILGCKINATVYEVRDVAPKKFMMCITFKLPLEVAVKEREKRKDVNDDADSLNKKLKPAE